VAVTLKNLERAKKDKGSAQVNEEGAQKERVLRPWESYEKEPDLMELITKRQGDKKVVKNSFKKNSPKKAEAPKIDEAEDLQAKLERAKQKYFGDLI